MKYIIISDFHLKFHETEDDRQRRHRVESFLSSLVGNVDGLILAGDVFDLWVEWGRVIIKNYFSILRIFYNLKQAGTRLIFLTGNHDFWLGNFLKDEIGFELYENYFSEVINDKKIFVSHGDLYTKNDLRYKVYRRFIRTKIIQKIFKLIHPDLALSFGNKLSRTSRARKGSVKSLAIKETGFLIKAEELSKDYDLIVFGHSHNPMRKEFGDSIYINSGDWICHNSYCYFDQEKIDLMYYNENYIT